MNRAPETTADQGVSADPTQVPAESGAQGVEPRSDLIPNQDQIDSSPPAGRTGQAANRAVLSPEGTDAAPSMIAKGTAAARTKARKPRAIEPGGPEDLEFHLQRVAAVWPKSISQRSIERLARLLGGEWET